MESARAKDRATRFMRDVRKGDEAGQAGAQISKFSQAWRTPVGYLAHRREDSSLNVAAAEAYRSRFRRVLEHIDAHLDEELTVDRLSGVAAFSRYHFHRQFSELFGMGVREYVQLVRFKRASYRLAFRTDSRIIEVALESGYESHEAFSRAFKKTIGQTPSGFRERPQWEPWHATRQRPRELRSLHMKHDPEAAGVTIVDFPETRVAVLEHRGDPRRLGHTIAAFIAWRRQNHRPPAVSATFNLFYDDPTTTPPEAFRLVSAHRSIARSGRTRRASWTEPSLPGAVRCSATSAPTTRSARA